jgi:hypothetical protein
MDRIEFINYKDKKILFLDFSNLEPKEALDIISKSKGIIAQMPQNSVLTLVNVKNTRFDAELANAFKEYTANNKPFVKAGAIYGLSGFQKVVYNAVMKFSGRKLPVFEELEKAKDWLVEQ